VLKEADGIATVSWRIGVATRLMHDNPKGLVDVLRLKVLRDEVTPSFDFRRVLYRHG
jgi:hypothetical protein